MAKKRIYEVARELGFPSNDIVRRAQSLGLAVTTASSGLDADGLARLMTSYLGAVAAPRPAELPVEDITRSDSPDASDGATSLQINQVERSLGVIANRVAAQVDRPVLTAELPWSRLDADRMAITLVALILVVANAIMRVSVGAGVVVHGVAFAIAMGFVILGKSATSPDALYAKSWLFAAIALVPTIAFGLAVIRPIPDWAFPVAFVVPVGFGALWIMIALPDRRVAGLNLLDWRGLIWSLAALPFVAISAATSFGEPDMYLGASGDVTGVGRVLVLLFAALVILIVYHGLIQGLAQPLVGRVAVPWIAVVFASTFAASWSGLAFLLAFGLVLGALRTQSGSIWPGFVATALVLVSLTVS